MGFVLEDVFQLFGDNITIDVCDAETGDLLDSYDGKNSVRELFNTCDVDRVVPVWNQRLLEVYIFLA